MANRVNFSVTCQPIVTLANPTSESIGGDLAQTDMPKPLGGQGQVQNGETDPSVTLTFGTTTGYGSGTVAYQNINTSASTTSLIADISGRQFLVARHTGHEFSSATALGDATTMAIEIWIGTQPICVLRPNEAIVLPLRGITGAVLFGGRLDSGTTGVALEVFVTT
jgi:hypothetical protein